MNPDPFSRVLALSAATDDVVLYREARRLGLSRRDVAHLQGIKAQPVMRGTIAVPPIGDPLRTAARSAQLAMPAGVISHATRELTADEVVTLDGLLATSVIRTLADCAFVADRVAFVSIVDSALNRDLLKTDRIGELADMLRRRRCANAAGWMTLVDGLAESPSETRVRIVLTDADLRPDSLQRLVVDNLSYPVARLDIAYERVNRRVGLEVDSAEHERPRALYRDRTKHNSMPSLGWDVRHVTARDALRKPSYVIFQVTDALGIT